jgi:hypothetical protein
MKRTASFITALLLLLGAATTVSAADHGDITGMAYDLSYGYAGDSDWGEVAPQDGLVEYIELTDAMFTWEDGYAPQDVVDEDEGASEDEGETEVKPKPAPLTSAQIKDARLTARATNSRVLESVTVNARESRIEVKFLEELVGVKEIEFDFDIILSIDGKQYRDYAMNFSGTFSNLTMVVDDGTDYADISGGDVVEAMDYIRSIDLDLGDGILLNTRLSEGRKYYDTARRVPGDDHDAFMREHPSVEEAVVLKTVGLSGSASTVTLGRGLGDYYVYSEAGEYLGRGNDKLAYSDVYYLSSKELEIADDKEPEDVKVPTDPAANTEPTDPTSSVPTSPPNSNNIPSTGGLPGMSPPNVHNNPGTGR